MGAFKIDCLKLMLFRSKVCIFGSFFYKKQFVDTFPTAQNLRASKMPFSFWLRCYWGGIPVDKKKIHAPLAVFSLCLDFGV